MTDLIRWEPNGYGGFLGYAGLVIDSWLFQVWRDPAQRPPWVLASTLPGLAARPQPKDDDPELLKAEAERLFRQWVSSLGAMFPGSSDSAWYARGVKAERQRCIELAEDRGAVCCSREPRCPCLRNRSEATPFAELIRGDDHA